jgi:AcrR family transcriptional regulator
MSANPEVAMARTRAAEVPIATTPAGEGDRVPVIRRPKLQDALDLARATFLSGARVEMGALAAQLDISQPTLYRWVGTREQLLDRVLERVTDEFLAVAIAEAEGDGDERVLDFVGRMMNATAAFQPALDFIAREPQLALRLVLAEAGAVHRSLARALRTVIGETRPPKEALALENQVDLAIQVCTGLQWGTIAVGDDPQVEGAVEVVRALLATGGRSAGRS